MKVLVNTETEEMIVANVEAKLRQLRCIAPQGINRSWLNELVKDIDSAFDKLASKVTSDNAGCL